MLYRENNDQEIRCIFSLSFGFIIVFVRVTDSGTPNSSWGSDVTLQEDVKMCYESG